MFHFEQKKLAETIFLSDAAMPSPSVLLNFGVLIFLDLIFGAAEQQYSEKIVNKSTSKSRMTF